MNSRLRLIGYLYVLGLMLQSYLGQVSHVRAEVVAQWTLHEWVGALGYVALAGATAWKAFLHDPNAAYAPTKPTPPSP